VAEVDLTIAGRSYRVACRAGEEDSLRAAAIKDRREADADRPL
jgi:cell division protein ZapA (FtsZ GTPase activity inhibitor)